LHTFALNIDVIAKRNSQKHGLGQFQPNHNKLDKNKHGHDLMSGTHKVSEHHLHQELQ
jgi:hypothetical protein